MFLTAWGMALSCGGGGAGANRRALPVRDGGLSVASLNMAMEHDAHVVLRDIEAAPAVRNADVLLFQEAVNSAASTEGVPGTVARSLGMRVVFSPAGPGVYDRGLAILSRYPIRDPHVIKLEVYNLRFHNRSRFALGATIDTPAGPLRLWNVHLDTRINAQDRVAQLAPVMQEAAAAPGPKIIGGDFNTNYMYWAWNVLPLPGLGRQAEAVRQYMAGHGFAPPLQDGLVTFKRTGMHLDWIYENGLKARAAAVDRIPFSDHHALVVQFE